MGISTYAFDTVFTIVFENLTFQNTDPTVWVCTDKAAFDLQLEKLAAMSHIRVIQQGPSLVKGER
jgi:hypothetical protein